jgi:hypothetical protein
MEPVMKRTRRQTRTFTARVRPYTVHVAADQKSVVVRYCGRAFRYQLQGDACDFENIACIGEQLVHKAQTGSYVDRLSSEEPITAYGRVQAVR